MKLVNMEQPQEETAKEATIAPITSDKKPSYPYGLRIDLNADSIKKLDIDISQLRVGDTVEIEAKAIITRVSISENEYDDKIQQNLDLQITDIGLDIAGEDGIFNRVFNEIEAKKDKILYGAETPTAGGFRKGLWDATR